MTSWSWLEFLPIDLEKVDLKKFPKFANVPYHEVTLREGELTAIHLIIL